MKLVIEIPKEDYKHFKELVNSLPKDPIFVDTTAYYIGNGKPLLKGQWKRHCVPIKSELWWECSECKNALAQIEKTNYCPICGADMRGEE